MHVRILLATSLGLGLLAGACSSGSGDGAPADDASPAVAAGGALLAQGSGSAVGSGGAPAQGSGGSHAPTAGGSFGGDASGGLKGSGGASAEVGGARGEWSGGASSGTGGAAPAPEPSLIVTGPGEGQAWQVKELTLGGTTATVAVKTNEPKQAWHGLGGTFNEQGWDALLALSHELRGQAVSMLFSRTEGIGFTYGRIPIGASDYAMDRYTCSDTPGSLDDFSIDRDRERLIPFAQAAQAVKSDIKFWGSPWSPPPWMKDNGEYDRGSMINSDGNFAFYAEYLHRWVEAYEAEEIDIDHIHPQNELGWQLDYPSCAWGPSDTTSGDPFLGKFVQDHLLPKFSDGLADVWYGVIANNKTFTAYWEDLSPAARQGVKGVGLQWDTMSRVDQVRVDAPQLLVMQAAHRPGNYPFYKSGAEPGYYTHHEEQTVDDTAPNDYNYARESWDIIKGWIDAGVNIYSAWNMVLDTSGLSMNTVRYWHQNALLVVDRQAGTLIATPAYYVFRHVGQYVDPGATVLGVTGEGLAFKNPDGSIVAVVHNTGDDETQTTLDVDGKLYQFAVPAYGWATANIQP
jgi:glucosylceramidase